MKQQSIETLQRVAGIVEGIAFTIKDNDVKNILLDVAQMIDSVQRDERDEE